MALTASVDSVVLDLGRCAHPLAPAELFGGWRPLEVELGMGKGRFLIERAASTPDTGFLGVERSRKYLMMAAARAARQGLSNVRLARTTAEDMLFRCLGDGSVQAMHVYFPDPWPKKRHQKRRLLGRGNLARIAEVLVSGGMLLIKTDHDAYAAAIREALAGEPRLTPVEAPGAFAELPATHYELRFAMEGRPVHAFALRRV